MIVIDIKRKLFYICQILETVRATEVGKNATDKDLNNVIMRWLNGAKDRNGGREERRKK